MTDTKEKAEPKKELDYEGIKRRSEAGSPAKEDIPDLIAEVERLNPSLKKDAEATKEQTEKAEVEYTAADINKMHRAELDALAKEHEIDLEGVNVEESKAYLISELCKE